MNTLLLDDDPFFSAILKRYLRLGGYQVDVVGDVAAASYRLKQGNFLTVVVAASVKDGVRFWEHGQRYFPEVAFVLATGTIPGDSRLYMPTPPTLERVLKAMQDAETWRNRGVGMEAFHAGR